MLEDRLGEVGMLADSLIESVAMAGLDGEIHHLPVNPNAWFRLQQIPGPGNTGRVNWVVRQLALVDPPSGLREVVM